MLSAAETSETLLSREEINREIASLKARIRELEAIRPPAIKRFFQFLLSKPQTRVTVYAESREQAEERVIARLIRQYGPTGYSLHPVVKEFLDAEEAALNSAAGSNLLYCLAPEEAAEFLADWKEATRDELPKRNGHRSRVERDIDDYERSKRQEAAKGIGRLPVA